MRREVFFGLMWLCVAPAMAATPAEQLAKDSYSYLIGKESMLDGAIRSGSMDDFNRFIYQPTVDMMQRWPKVGDAAYDKQRRCHFALDAFRIYSEDQFKAGGKLTKDTGSFKAYLEQKAECKASLPK